MKRTILWFVVAVAILADLGCSQTGKSAEAMLQGVVRSKDAGLMEGVLVSARREGSTSTVTVVSDNQGRYRFPAGKLLPGKHDLSTWAVGFESLEKSGVEVLPTKTATMDFLIEKQQDKNKFALQLSHTEWELTLGSPQILGSPGAASCAGCHLIGRIMVKKQTASEWEQVISRMKNHGEGSAFRRGGIVVAVPPEQSRVADIPLTPVDRALAQYLAAVAGSERLSGLPFKTLPRPTGAGTQVILTSYDLARQDSGPHDVAIDAEGMIWHSEVARPYLGKLNPRTGETKLYRVPEVYPGFLPGTFDVDIDQEGNPWFGMIRGGGIGRLDKKTEQVTVWRLEPEFLSSGQFVAPTPDGRIWFADSGSTNPKKNVHRLDPRTGVIEDFGPLPDKENHSFYDITADSKGNAYFAGLRGNTFGKVDAQTGQITYYPPPTPNSGPRRIQVDGRDRIWFAEFLANKVAMFDPATEKFQEWPLPSPNPGPYFVAPDKNGEMAWIAGNNDDRIYRFNPQTGQFVAYAWPRAFPNVQRLVADHSAKVPTVWVAEDNYGMATKLEILEDGR